MGQRKRKALNIAFGEVLKEARADSGHSQEKLADLINYSRVAIGYLEIGVRSPSLEALLRLEKALGFSYGELVKRTAKRIKAA